MALEARWPAPPRVFAPILVSARQAQRQNMDMPLMSGWQLFRQTAPAPTSFRKTGAAPTDQLDRRIRQGLQMVDSLRCKLPGLDVVSAERTDRLAIDQQPGRGVEANERSPHHFWVGLETVIFQRVLDNDQRTGLGEESFAQ